MKRKPLRLVERLKELASVRKQKPKNWFGKLPEDLQAEFSDAKRAWKDGAIGASGKQLAKDIVEMCAEAGVATCGVAGVRRWLYED